MTTTQTTAATITYASGGAFERDPEPDLRYGFWLRLGDTWAGWADRSSLAANAGEAASPWLERLHFECVNRLEAEHRATVASLAYQDQRIVQLRERITTGQSRLAVLAAEVDAKAASLADAESAPISDEPTTVAEQGDARSVVRTRNAQRRAAALQPRRDALASIQGGVTSLGTAIIQDQIDLQMAITDRRSLWSILMVRSAHLVAHYNRRAGTYVRAASRRGGGLVSTPSAPRPDWLTDGTIPPEPSQWIAATA